MIINLSKSEFSNFRGKYKHVMHGEYHVENDTYYFVNGNLHREDGPAIEMQEGYYMWYYNNKLHRTDGPAVNYVNGQFYYLNGELHREDGPALIRNGISKYFFHGKECSSMEELYMIVNGLENYL